MGELIPGLIIIYIATGFYFRQRERRFRPRCPRGLWPTTTTVLFWSWKITVVFYRKWRG